MVSYGPDDPYTDYTLKGQWNSSREWVGKMPIKVLINQGHQYFRVKDAVAADDHWLTTGTDWGRFEFDVTASGEEALTLQSEGRVGSIYFVIRRERIRRQKSRGRKEVLLLLYSSRYVNV